jgi:hypothetical protein
MNFQKRLESGMFAATEPQTYAEKVLSLFGSSVLAYLPLDDTSGTVARDISGHARHDTYNGPSLAATASPVLGKLAPNFDGVNDDIDIYPAANAMRFNVAGAILGWSKIPAAAWTDGAGREIMSIYALNSDNFVLRKPNINNQIWPMVLYGGANLAMTPPFQSVDWFSWAFTWSKDLDQLIFYVNSYNPWVVMNGLGTWSGGLFLDYCRLGGFGGGTNPHKGSISDVIFVDRMVTQPEVLNFTQFANHLKKLIIIGDSIEVGWNTWPYTFASTRGYILKDRAIGGYGIMNGGMDLEVNTAANDDGDLIIIALGFNDDNSGDMAALQAKFETDLQILKACHPRATIYVQNVLPCWTNNSGTTPVDKSNVRTAIAAACASQSVTCWDTFTDPWIAANQTSDGVHLIAAGHTAVNARIAARVP